ncbi:MarR family winged helix-turn-helix transcriptional regulator [Herbaspirillum huttiense]|uniref:MarR family winged helix-turn-helix transcriptional regulator n=1 Tax=Herbaspirillum huttiense TaxID=863372 RepID=UPI0004272C11|nr:MarR family transcriptional regulator [Herbaspirillum huttiense]
MMSRTKAMQLSDLVLAIFRLNGALIDWGNEFVAPEGLSSARWQMLGAIAIAERPLTVPQIAANMGMTRQGAQKQVNQLVDEGHMQSQVNPIHQRSPLYELTQRGQAVHAAIYERWIAHATQTAAKIKGTDLKALTDIVATLTAVYSKEIDAP